MKLPVKFRRSSLLTKVVVLLVVVSATVILVSQRNQIRTNQEQYQELVNQASALQQENQSLSGRHRGTGFRRKRKENRPG